MRKIKSVAVARRNYQPLTYGFNVAGTNGQSSEVEMGRVIVFPAHSKVKPTIVEGGSPVTALNVPTGAAKPGMLSCVFSIAWIFFLLTWPLVQWLVAFDIVYQFVRALYYWSTPGVYAGFTFVIHLIAGSALTYLVATRKIK